MKMNMKLNKQVINLKALSSQPIMPVQIKMKPPKKAPKKVKREQEDDVDELLDVTDEDLDDILG